MFGAANAGRAPALTIGPSTWSETLATNDTVATMRWMGRVWLLAIVVSPPASLAALQVNGTAGGDAGPIAQAARTGAAPVIDGVLGDEVWAAAVPIRDFVQHEPLEGEPATERTEVRVLYDGDALYVAAWLHDSDTSGILLGENRRDANLRDADAFLLVFDTFHDRQNAYVFGTTPAGIEYDGQVVGNGQGGLTTTQRSSGGAGATSGFNLNWDGSWEVATSVDADGWYAEFRIPFSTLRYGSGGAQEWGLNIARTVRRRNEESFWTPLPRHFTLYRVSEAGTLQGIETPTRRTARVTPYVLASTHRDFVGAAETDNSAEVGGDAKIGLTPGLNLDLTYNTDFAQVESDEQQINLTRFSLFFPEKRPFFLENAGTFSIGSPRSGSEQGLELFFSRRIGIGDQGEPVPILGGGRLTGKVGGMRVGLIDIQTEAVDPSDIDAQNYSVGRLMRELPNRSRLGVLLVNRLNTDSTADHNLTYALDGRWGIGPNLNLDLFLARTETPGRSGRDHGIVFIGAYQSRDWDFGVEYREIGEDFNPEVGFLPRDDYRLIIARAQRNVRIPSLGWLREWRPHVLVRNFLDFDGFTETRFIHFDNAGEFSNGATWSTGLNFRREGLRDPFPIATGITIPAATYDFVDLRVRFGTDPSATLSLSGDVTVGGFFSGHRKSIASTLTNRFGSTWAAALRVNYDDVDLAEGSFATTLIGLRTAYSFTPRIFVQSLLQYNDQTENFSGNVRFGWLNTAGTGLYVVFNEVRRTETPTGPRDRALIVKFTKQFGVVQ